MRRDYGQHENVEALRDRLARRKEVIAVALKEQERSLRQIENALGGLRMNTRERELARFNRLLDGRYLTTRCMIYVPGHPFFDFWEDALCFVVDVKPIP